MAFRFELPTGASLALPVGQHLSVRGTGSEGQVISRQYTPTTCEDHTGYFELVIKIYPTGQMGNYLKNLPVGSLVGVRGPSGSLQYHGAGAFTIRRKDAAGAPVSKSYSVKQVGMLAGGSGVTPMLQLVRYISARPEDPTAVSLVLGNQTEGDIMCRAELEAAAERNPNFRLHFMVDRCSNTAWRYGTGYITADLIKQRLPAPGPNTLVLLCGPPPMMDVMKRNLATLGYTDDMIFTY
jgi:cytochrome-b5 reductase